MDPRHTKQLTINQKQVYYLQKNRALAITPVMANLIEERLESSIAFKNVGVHYFGLFIVKIGQGTKSDCVVCSLVELKGGWT